MVDLLGLPSMASVSSQDENGTLIIEAQINYRISRCPECGRSPCHRHDSRRQEYTDSPIRGKPVRIRINRQRYRCQDCTKTFFEPLSGFSAKREMTRRLVYLIGQKALVHPFAEVAREMALDVQTNRDVFFDFAAFMRRTILLPTPRVMGIDETKRAGDMRTVLTNLEERTYFDVLSDYNMPALRKYFASLADRSKVKIVAMDLSPMFQKVISEQFPKAVIVTDKYHVVRMANNAVEAVHRKIRKDLPKGERHAAFRSRGVVNRRAHRLDDKGKQALEQITSRYPLLAAAHKAKEDLYAIYVTPDRKEANGQMDRWLTELPREVAPCFKSVVSALTTRREHILNYFEHRYTNAFTESANGISKLIQRRGKRYGFEVLRLKLLYGKEAVKVKVKEEEFLIDDEGQDDGTMRDVFLKFTAVAPVCKRRVTRKVLIGPECAKVADLVGK